MIREDFSYLSPSDKKAIELDLARMAVHSLRIERRPYTEKEKTQNALRASSMTQEQWVRHCTAIKNKTAKKVKPLLDYLACRLVFHQYKGTTQRSDDYDVFFWCRCPYGERDYSYVRLSPNSRRTVEKQIMDMTKVLEHIRLYNPEGLGITVQYTAVYHTPKNTRGFSHEMNWGTVSV